MRGFKYILTMLALCLSASMWGQYNPANPAEPGAPVTLYTLTLQADPSGGGSFNINTTTSYAEGTRINLRAYTASNFSFVSWEQDGETVSTAANFTYTMPAKNAKLIAHYVYTPSSPTEPNEPNLPAKPVYSRLYLTASPASGGSFNIATGNSYEVGTTVRVQANPATNFTFVNWTQDGEVLSTSRTYNYVMMEGDDANRLVANFSYTPGNPGEPAEPEARKIYHRVFLQCDPAGGGYFSVESGNQYEEGTTQTFRAYNNQWYTFQHWTRDGEVVSTSSSYSLTIPAEDVTLVAHYSYNYNPGNPNEPGQATGKRLNVFGMTANGVQGQSIVYPVMLENTEEVYGLTVVVRFPEGFAVNTANVVQAERAAGHTLAVVPLDDNAYRFDLTGTTPLTGQNGKIFDVPVTIGTSVEANQSYSVVLSNAARVNLDESKEVISTRNGFIYVEEMREDGLYAQYTYEKLQSRVKFTNLSSDKMVSCIWDFGDGTTSTEANPLHIYAASGYYDVKLTVKGEVGTDVAQMTVLINDENTWRVDGTLFLDTEVQGVRYFTSAADLFSFMAAHPISGNLRLAVKPGMTFGYELTKEHQTLLSAIQTSLADNGYTLTILKNGEGVTPTLCFGQSGEAFDFPFIDFFMNWGRQLECDDVNLRLWDIAFNVSKLKNLSGQTVLSGEPTAEVDFSSVSTELDFSWTAIPDCETATGFVAEGTGCIPSMTIVSGTAEETTVLYNITVSYQGAAFCRLTHTITLKPALEGTFTDMTPADGSLLETTTVTLSWNNINNAVYDVYLWNAANQRPTAPVAQGITDLTYTARNFCQNNKSYKWQIVARNSFQQLASDTLHFSVKYLPDLHVSGLTVTGELEAGRTATISWTVRNDGEGATDHEWQDRVWLVSDIYNGTNQKTSQLLATVQHVQSLAPGQQYTGSAEVLLSGSLYGSCYLLVASDMSSVTSIDWTGVGGTIVNPYEPVSGGYDYLFATTLSSGNELEEHGETTTRSDNFFYQKVEVAMPTMDEADWNQLTAIYASMGNGEGWTQKWNFDVEHRTVQTLPGVSIRDGRVVAVNLAANGLSGAFPYGFFALPALQTLDLSGNRLEGDLGQGMTACMESQPLLGSALTTLNISDNQLSGNVGVFAEPLTKLVSLNASGNKIEEVSPMIAATVTSLNLGSQAISKVLDVNLEGLSVSELMEQIPSILLYNHQRRTYNNSINLLCSGTDDWQIVMAFQDGGLTLPYVSVQNAYRGQSGDVLQVAVVDAQRKPEGSTLSMKLSFDKGDANFNGSVDVIDLQALINYAFEAYKTNPFNFTAANLWADEVINVQDVVRMTDLLLNIDEEDKDDEAGARPSAAKRAFRQEEEASLYVQDGQVWISSDVPVAAFELTIRNAYNPVLNTQLEEMGFTCRMNSNGRTTRVVGYSLNGATLPTGTTPVCRTNQGEVVSAVLANAEAGEITVRLSGETTGISEGLTAKSNESGEKIGALATAPVYNLNGQRVGKAKKGLYIQHGRKIVK